MMIISWATPVDAVNHAHEYASLCRLPNAAVCSKLGSATIVLRTVGIEWICLPAGAAAGGRLGGQHRHHLRSGV